MSVPAEDLLLAGGLSFLIFAIVLGTFTVRLWRNTKQVADPPTRIEPRGISIRRLALLIGLALALIVASRIITSENAAGISSVIWIGTALAQLAVAYALARQERKARRIILVAADTPWLGAPTLKLPSETSD